MNNDVSKKLNAMSIWDYSDTSVWGITCKSTSSFFNALIKDSINDSLIDSLDESLDNSSFRSIHLDYDY